MTDRDFAIFDIARTCHEVNRAYCQGLGDASQPSWIQAPHWQRESAVKGVAFALANPLATPAGMHRAWCEQKVADGWRYGEVKDAERKTHPCLVPYDHLPATQRAKDSLFLAVVHSMKQCRTVRSRL